MKRPAGKWRWHWKKRRPRPGSRRAAAKAGRRGEAWAERSWDVGLLLSRWPQDGEKRICEKGEAWAIESADRREISRGRCQRPPALPCGLFAPQYLKDLRAFSASLRFAGSGCR